MNYERINKILKSHGLKLTPQRIAVLSAIVDNRTHPSAEDLIKIIKDKYPSISVGTIYNILDVFVNKGIIQKLHTGDSVMRYDPVVEDHHHIHLEGSKEILDYFDDELVQMVKSHIKSKWKLDKIEIESVKINILGRKVELEN